MVHTPVRAIGCGSRLCQHRRRYNTYLSCLKTNDGDGSACKKNKFLAEASCPVAWLDNWKELRADGRFPGVDAPIEEE